MSAKKTAQAQAADDGRIKDPSEWTTGEEPMTGAQKSYLHTLARRVGEEVREDDLTKAEASEMIDELKDKAGLDDGSANGRRSTRR